MFHEKYYLSRRLGHSCQQGYDQGQAAVQDAPYHSCCTRLEDVHKAESWRDYQDQSQEMDSNGVIPSTL